MDNSSGSIHIDTRHHCAPWFIILCEIPDQFMTQHLAGSNRQVQHYRPSQQRISHAIRASHNSCLEYLECLECLELNDFSSQSAHARLHQRLRSLHSMRSLRTGKTGKTRMLEMCLVCLFLAPSINKQSEKI